MIRNQHKWLETNHVRAALLKNVIIHKRLPLFKINTNVYLYIISRNKMKKKDTRIGWAKQGQEPREEPIKQETKVLCPTNHKNPTTRSPEPPIGGDHAPN